MKKLLTMFNPNDPTPTAMAICSQNLSEVHILLVGEANYTSRQEQALERFKLWTSGSVKPVDFPEHMWLPRMDWESLPDRGISIEFHSIESISEFNAKRIGPDIVVDFLSGSKELSVELMTQLNLTYGETSSIKYEVTQLSGHIVNVVTGEERAHCTTLSIRERVWLTAGKFALTGKRGSKEVGEQVKDWGLSFAIPKKIMPRETDELSKLLSDQDVHFDFEHGYWLEHFSAHVLATWPDVLESWHQLHVFPPTWKEFVAAAMSKKDLSWKYIGYPEEGVTEWPYGFDENGKRLKVKEMKKYVEWANNDQTTFFSNTLLTPSQLEYLWNFAFIGDVDVVAILKNGYWIFGECKHTTRFDVSWSHRTLALASLIAPRSSICAIIQSHLPTMKNQKGGINILRWPDLKNPLININASDTRKISIFSPRNLEQ